MGSIQPPIPALHPYVESVWASNAHCEAAAGCATSIPSTHPRPHPEAGTSVTLHIHVDDADALIERALAAGAILLRPATDAF